MQRSVVAVEIEFLCEEVIALFASETARDLRRAQSVRWELSWRLAGRLVSSSQLLVRLRQHDFGSFHLARVVHGAGLSEALGSVFPLLLVIVSESFCVDCKFIFRTSQQDVIENSVCFGDFLAQMDHAGALEDLIPNVFFGNFVKQRQTISILLLFVTFVDFIVKLRFFVGELHLLALASDHFDFHVDCTHGFLPLSLKIAESMTISCFVVISIVRSFAGPFERAKGPKTETTKI